MTDKELDRAACEAAGPEPLYRWTWNWPGAVKQKSKALPRAEASSQRQDQIDVFQGQKGGVRPGPLQVSDLEPVYFPVSTDPAASAQLKAAAMKHHRIWPVVFRYEGRFFAFLQPVTGKARSLPCLRPTSGRARGAGRARPPEPGWREEGDFRGAVDGWWVPSCDDEAAWPIADTEERAIALAVVALREAST